MIEKLKKVIKDFIELHKEEYLKSMDAQDNFNDKLYDDFLEYIKSKSEKRKQKDNIQNSFV